MRALPRRASGDRRLLAEPPPPQALALEPRPLVGIVPAGGDTEEAKGFRIRELRSRMESQAKAQSFKERADLSQVDDPRGTPEFPFAKPMVWVKDPFKTGTKRRPMVSSLLRAAQEADAAGQDGDAVGAGAR